MRQYAREQYERDLVHGRSEQQKRNEVFNEWKGEHCMSGQVMERDEKSSLSDDNMRRMREFVVKHLAHLKEADAVLKSLPSGTNLFVRLDGKLYHVRRSYASSPLELPVVVSEATVIGE